VGDLPAWLRGLAEDISPLKDARPWIPFAAIRFLERTLTKDMRVFEYGSGGSTLFFGERVREVVSIEHDPRWFETVTNVVRQRGWMHCTVEVIEPRDDPTAVRRDPSDATSYLSSDAMYLGQSFRKYASSIDRYPDRYFDLIQIDGRARPSCFLHSLPKVKIGG